MNQKKKLILVLIIGILVALHVGLFAAGGKWRKMSLVLLVVDAVSALLVIGAVKEARKLEKK